MGESIVRALLAVFVIVGFVIFGAAYMLSGIDSGKAPSGSAFIGQVLFIGLPTLLFGLILIKIASHFMRTETGKSRTNSLPTPQIRDNAIGRGLSLIVLGIGGAFTVIVVWLVYF